MDKINSPIGFFDSGVGGLSVLKEAIKLLPKEDFIYYGDSKNAPYGTRDVEEVKTLTFRAIDFLYKKDVKAAVIACNTATSAAILDLRSYYNKMPIIGIEPALKPAVELHRKGKIIIMATPMTLMENKFRSLMKKYDESHEIVPLPCAGLPEYIERGILEGEELEKYLEDRFSIFDKEYISSIVLGCTHYPFIKGTLKKVLNNDIPIIDGSEGTAKQLKMQLISHSLLREENKKQRIEIYNSLNSQHIIDFSYRLLDIKQYK